MHLYTQPHTYRSSCTACWRVVCVCVMRFGDHGHYCLQGDPSVRHWHLVSRSLWPSWGSRGIRCRHHAAMVMQPKGRGNIFIIFFKMVKEIQRLPRWFYFNETSNSKKILHFNKNLNFLCMSQPDCQQKLPQSDTSAKQSSCIRHPSFSTLTLCHLWTFVSVLKRFAQDAPEILNSRE